jgi:hypothetical protein
MLIASDVVNRLVFVELVWMCCCEVAFDWIVVVLTTDYYPRAHEV